MFFKKLMFYEIDKDYFLRCQEPSKRKLFLYYSKIKCKQLQEGRDHWSVYYTGLRSLIITVSYVLAQQLWELLFDFD